MKSIKLKVGVLAFYCMGLFGGYAQAAVYDQSASNFNQIPDVMNYEKLNIARQCTPAELYAGKKSCNYCDNDVANVIVKATPETLEMKRRFGGISVDESNTSRYRGHEYALDYIPVNTKTKIVNEFPYGTGKKPIGFGRRDQNYYNEPEYIVFKGYNLTGMHPVFDGLNNRTVCQTLKPNVTAPANATQEQKNKIGLGGAAALGIAGMAIAGNSPSKYASLAGSTFGKIFGNPNGNKGVGQALGKAMGSTSFTPTATEMFACLEYYTNTNPSVVGGDHLKGNINPMVKTKCIQPLQMYYQTMVAEIYCGYSPCDGKLDGYFEPGTRSLRLMLLMTNRFIMVGKTYPESVKIAKNRPLSMMGY